MVYTDVDITPLGFEYGELLGEKKIFECDKGLVDIAMSCQDETLPKFYCGMIGTSDKFITSKEVEFIQKQFNDAILCSEMEGCAVAHTCSKVGIKCLIIRSLSDVPSTDDKSHEGMMDNLGDASKNVGMLVSKIISKL